jgi:hypothetical protein
VTLTESFSNFQGSGPVPPAATQTVDLANCPGGRNGCYADVLDTMSLYGTQCLPDNYNNGFTQGFTATIGTTPYNLTTQNSVSIGNFDGALNATVTISKQ